MNVEILACENEHQKIIYKWTPLTFYDCPLCMSLYADKNFRSNACPQKQHVIDKVESSEEVYFDLI